jgi:NADH:ubiquinone oxidoreductase subunit F (NADH-binding)
VTANLDLVAEAELSADRPRLLGAEVHYLGSGAEAVTDLEVDDLVAHCRRFGPRPRQVGDALIDTLEAAGLTGRGGAHHPAAAKWRAVRATGTPAVVVGNGAEGEPLSRKDAALLELRPHLVLDGLACAAEAVGARDTVIWLHEGAHACRSSVAHALDERRAAGQAEPPARIVTSPDRYVSGESSAVVSALAGGPALPRFSRLPAARAGVRGAPTLIHNVETLARVALIARHGAAPAATTLLTIAAPGHRVVLEVGVGSTIRNAVGAVLGRAPVHAVLVGGYGGSWAPWSAVADAKADEADLHERGLSLGAGVVLPLQAGDCGVAQAATVADYLADSSARQCGPCMFGLRAVADLMISLADRSLRRRDAPRLHRFLAEISGRGGCHHPDGAVRMIASAVTTFEDDVHAHLRGRCLHNRSDTGRNRRD